MEEYSLTQEPSDSAAGVRGMQVTREETIDVQTNGITLGVDMDVSRDPKQQLMHH